jgi:capsular polysaccharide transport system permease protein
MGQENLTTFVQNVELVRLRGEDSALGEPVERQRGWKAWARRRLGLLLIVVAPTLATAFYAFALATPRYESAAQFVVREPGNGTASQIANMISGSSVIRSVDDGYVVSAYVISRDALAAVASKDGFRDMIKPSGRDFLWWYPPLFTHDTAERLYEYFKRLVSVSYDQTTGIITLRADGFRPQDAQRLVAALLRHAEELVNSMNDRAQHDAIRVAEDEVNHAKADAYAATDTLTQFRDRERFIDPKLLTDSVVQNITALALTMAQSNAQLEQLQRTSPLSPQIAATRARIASLDAQIKAERGQLAGRAGSLAPSIAEYDKLLLNQQFAESMFASTLASLEAARADALRQRAFVEDITQPNLPDRPAYPERLMMILIVLVVAGMVYRIGAVFLKDTLDHATR